MFFGLCFVFENLNIIVLDILANIPNFLDRCWSIAYWHVVVYENYTVGFYDPVRFYAQVYSILE